MADDLRERLWGPGADEEALVVLPDAVDLREALWQLDEPGAEPADHHRAALVLPDAAALRQALWDDALPAATSSSEPIAPAPPVPATRPVREVVRRAHQTKPAVPVPVPAVATPPAQSALESTGPAADPVQRADQLVSRGPARHSVQRRTRMPASMPTSWSIPLDGPRS